MVSVVGFAACYILWVLWIAFAADIWVYPFLEKLDALSIAAFFAFSVGVFIFIYHIGEWVAQWRWGQGVSVEKKKL